MLLQEFLVDLFFFPAAIGFEEVSWFSDVLIPVSLSRGFLGSKWIELFILISLVLVHLSWIYTAGFIELEKPSSLSKESIASL